MKQTKWKLLKEFAGWPAGTELIQDRGAWFVVRGGDEEAVPANVGKMLDGLVVAPKNLIERIGGTI